MTTLTKDSSTSSEPLCPAVGGLRETLRAKIDWFLERSHRATEEEVSVRLMKRTGPYDIEVLGREQWRDGKLEDKSGRMELELPSDVDLPPQEAWVEMDRVRVDLYPTIKGNYIDAATIELIEKARREHYVARDAGDTDRFEIHETRCGDDPDARWQMEISIPMNARREQPIAHGELKSFDNEWSKPATETALEKYPLDRVLEDTRLKMRQMTYAAAIKLAKAMRGPKIIELGANYWPVLALSVLAEDPNAEYAVIDVHYNGLWVMEKLLEREAPELLPRVHRHIMDFTEPMPLESERFDLALAVAAFGPRHHPEDVCASATKEIHRVLAPNGLLVFDGASFEERSSAYLWLFVQLFDVIDQRNCGGHRNVIARKR